MPLYRTVHDEPIWLPAKRVLQAEPSPGGLGTTLTVLPPPGIQGLLQIEVKDRVEEHADELDEGWVS